MYFAPQSLGAGKPSAHTIKVDDKVLETEDLEFSKENRRAERGQEPPGPNPLRLT